MKIRFALTCIQGVHVAVFDAKPDPNTVNRRAEVLDDLTVRARGCGLTVDDSALVYLESGRMEFYGDRDLVKSLESSELPQWTHHFDV